MSDNVNNQNNLDASLDAMTINAKFADHKCDTCGSLFETLYEIDGKLLCSNDVPFAYRYGNKRHRLVNKAICGSRALLSKRSQLAAV